MHIYFLTVMSPLSTKYLYRRLTLDDGIMRRGKYLACICSSVGQLPFILPYEGRIGWYLIPTSN